MNTSLLRKINLKQKHTYLVISDNLIGAKNHFDILIYILIKIMPYIQKIYRYKYLVFDKNSLDLILKYWIWKSFVFYLYRYHYNASKSQWNYSKHIFYIFEPGVLSLESPKFNQFFQFWNIKISVLERNVSFLNYRMYRIQTHTDRKKSKWKIIFVQLRYF